MSFSLTKSERIAWVILNQDNSGEDWELADRDLTRMLEAVETDSQTAIVVLEICGGDSNDDFEPTVFGDKERQSDPGQAATLIRNFSKPVIASVQGTLNSTLSELTLACHIVFASDGSLFNNNDGFSPNGTEIRSDSSNERRDPAFQAHELKAAGKINRILSAKTLKNETSKLAIEIASRAPLAVQSCLAAVIGGREISLAEGLRLETDIFCRIFDTLDMKEGVAAFLEKRVAKFRGR